MTNYCRYLPVNSLDEAWGLTVLNTGYTHIPKASVYPSKDHPSNYYFTWKNGRVLHEYQIIYITEGEGVFESEHCKLREIKAGTIILLFPNERHRYKPDKKTGWHEYWIGINGPIIENLIARDFFRISEPVIDIGIKDNIFSLFLDIIEKTKSERPGYQPAISGAAVHLLGVLFAEVKQASFAGEYNIHSIVDRARYLLRDHMNQHITPEEIAKELQVGYSWFRKVFRKYTGMAPNQYLIQLKIQQSKELLLLPENSVKTVAFMLNFESAPYFSKLFKIKTGLTPQDYRNKALKKYESA
ncbi:helix-turn-helix domain-containing protein [Mucilaginibacter phyllosphaerae]|uniref:AraC family transcriptional regulator n=1 Tax=Mucilaginibacter phyllosphaerae TaxID=1812349 RepID=A0A4Y8ADH2_9SPHI|nr:AraC family transcriptional regulator [Mucilaginibacter phyllosphaerae]MBB3969207.1 AraC-like DNA-binding protein [Mucilaginibacter phyllosphaerae]TEW65988.1 AraC family transcriptional regulator [Mucilaginibacter phyllosphaerae]GGH06991.1 transcriptional regulator [Mucilaginibacter phyllosphaerae]